MRPACTVKLRGTIKAMKVPYYNISPDVASSLFRHHKPVLKNNCEPGQLTAESDLLGFWGCHMPRPLSNKIAAVDPKTAFERKDLLRSWKEAREEDPRRCEVNSCHWLLTGEPIWGGYLRRLQWRENTAVYVRAQVQICLDSREGDCGNFLKICFVW